MDLEKTLPNCLVTAVRTEENVIVRRIEEGCRDMEVSETYQLSTFFSLLEGSLFNNQTDSSLQKITILDLSSSSLSELPKALRLLHLKVLNLSWNKLTKAPSCLYAAGLESLQSLDLSHNLISEFDKPPDCLANLKSLQLNHNLFENTPRWFLTLEELDYSQNKAKYCNLVSHHCDFSTAKLRQLTLRSSCLTDLNMSWIKKLRNLQDLNISNETTQQDQIHSNKFQDLNSLFTNVLWETLTVLHLSNLDLSFLPMEVFQIITLKELWASHNLLSWLPDGIEYLEKLQLLDVAHNDLIVLPSEIVQLKNLKVLLVSCNKLDEVPQMPKGLEVLDIYDNYIQSVDISNLSHIKHLDLECNYVSTRDLTFNYSSKCDSLRALYCKTDRISVPKALDSMEKFCTSPNDSEDDTCEYKDVTMGVEVIVPQEDWDMEYATNASSNIQGVLNSDDEFDGLPVKNMVVCKPSIYLYCEEEDWIFVDAD